MTKTKLVGRGGARPGAGRKKKSPATEQSSSSDRLTERALPAVPMTNEELEHLAKATLVDVLRNSESDNARVAAARDLLDRVRGKPGAAKLDPGQSDMFGNSDDGWGRAAQPQQGNLGAHELMSETRRSPQPDCLARCCESGVGGR